MSVVIDETVGKVQIHPSVEVMPNTYIKGPCILQEGVRVFPGAVIGCDAEHRTAETDVDQVIFIGARTHVRENVVIQRGIRGDKGTHIGADCLLMHGTHVAHDVIIGDGVTISPGAVTGGHCVVQEGAYLGIQASMHQHTVMGAHSMLGMGAVLKDDLPPGLIAVGVPARILGVNRRKLELLGLKFSDLSWDDWRSARMGRGEAIRMSSLERPAAEHSL